MSAELTSCIGPPGVRANAQISTRTQAPPRVPLWWNTACSLVFLPRSPFGNTENRNCLQSFSRPRGGRDGTRSPTRGFLYGKLLLLLLDLSRTRRTSYRLVNTWLAREEGEVGSWRRSLFNFHLSCQSPSCLNELCTFVFSQYSTSWSSAWLHSIH